MDRYVFGILKGAAGLAADANAFHEFFKWVKPHILAATRTQRQVDSGGLASASAGDNRTAAQHQIQDEDKLEKLEHSLWAIQTTITSTMYDLIDRLEWQSHKETEARHLRQIKDVVYDAEDLLDEYNYYALKVKVEASKNDLGQDHRHKTFLEFLDSVNFSKVMEIQDRLKLVLDQSKDLDLHKTPKKFDRLVRPETCRVLDEPKIFGREKELEELKQMLGVHQRKRGRPVARPTTGEARRAELPVLPIVGMGGVGKTTMAQQICEDGAVQKHFGCIIWICVSDEFEVNRLTKEVLKSLGEKNSQDTDSRDTLMVNLRDRVKSKKFFLVLDDMWDDVLKDEKGWRTFHRALSNGLEGSKILVTTRSSKVANLVSNSNHYELKGLQEDILWNFFKLCAFGSNSSPNNPDLECIGRDILPKLKGSPLAAKTLGRLLKSNLSIEHWEDISKNELWRLQQDETDILPALRLSYVYLPQYMKRCFSICALFPKDHIFEKEFLADIWVAQGYVEPQDASSCFDDLANRSFFQHAARQNNKYVIHDLIHDTAQLVSKDECFIIQHVSDLAKIPSKVRHLSISTDGNISCEQLVYICTQHKKLRSLVCKKSYRGRKGVAPMIDRWFMELDNIRVLIFNLSTVQELPKSIANSKHLRYLGLFGSSTFETLPSSVSLMYHLQTINAKDCKFKRYPERLGNLISLNKIISRGFRYIKNNFDELYLSWPERNNDETQMTEEQIKLLPHPHWNFQHLIIEYYPGESFSSWHWPDLLSMLTSLRVTGCKNIQSLSLTPISVSEASRNCTVEVFSSLSKVIINRCDALLSLDEFLMPAYMPALKSIVVDACYQLASLPVDQLHRFSRLEELGISACPELNMQRIMTLPSSLQKLCLWNCPSIERIDNSHLGSSPAPQLLGLHLRRCPDLTSVLGVISLPEIGNVSIDNCPKLTEIQQPFRRGYAWPN
ncbi:putative disease resistance protein RGA3 [Oryza brachyantha]|uniref:putative disease resistance protein RGA3 n=1 Tax=Oryza brachyantha TaxID=4533 RepID=UPI0007761A30|nr:putative disease resistance protein RGA3 [Oryza brachyantha]XP_040379548.1 putative disease resistance protein RGA3 [Oryza brachyantha]